jgi:hypothetical protein
VAKEGTAILESPSRVEGWLAAWQPEADSQRQFLVAALEERIPQALMQLHDPKRLEGILCIRREFTSEESRWAVEAWREALNVHLAGTSQPMTDAHFDLYCFEEVKQDGASANARLDASDQSAPVPDASPNLSKAATPWSWADEVEKAKLGWELLLNLGKLAFMGAIIWSIFVALSDR